MTEPLPLFTRHQLEIAAVDGRTLSTKRHRESYTRVRKGLYTPTATFNDADRRDQHLVHVRAAIRRVGQPIVVSHQSAAVLLGGQLMREPDAVSLTREQRCYAKFPRVRVYAATLFPEHCTEISGLPVTVPARTGVDVARHEGLAGGLTLLDSLLRAGACTREGLEAVLAACARWPGIKAATAAVQHADPLAENALESASRAGMILCGIPLPELQQWVVGADGKDYRTDFLWREQRLIGESDGRVKYDSDPQALWWEKQRQEALERMGWRFIRWGWTEAIRPQTHLGPLLRQALNVS